jgi:two-component system, OmpR family, KDP operon response regulator KdpE
LSRKRNEWSFVSKTTTEYFLRLLAGLALMHDCASDFSRAVGAQAGLTSSDREEWRAALAILGREMLPAGVAWLSVDHDGFAERLAHHVARKDRVTVLAGRARTARRQAALAAGAFEFLTTGPIDPAELAARLRLIETGSALPPDIALAGNHLRLNGAEHELSEREAEIMALLIEAKGRFVAHEVLLSLWGRHANDLQYLRVAIAKLRRRIEPEPDMPRFLLSEAAIGYRLGTGRD